LADATKKFRGCWIDLAVGVGLIWRVSEPLLCSTNMLLRHSRRLVRYTGDSSTVAKFLSTKGGRVSVAELSEMSLEDQMSERKSSTQGQRSEGRIAGIKVQVKPFN
jgi:hypothetical protein